MGWGEARPPSQETAADRLAAAVRVWRDNPTTSHGEALIEALDAYDEARSRPPVLIQIEAETGRRSSW